MKKIIITTLLIGLSAGIFAQNHINPQKWNIADTFSLATYDDLSAIASDGQYIYLTEWSSDKFIKTDFNGNILEEFTISGISQIRDLTYDGQYFYGGRADSIIYKLDLDQKQLIKEITIASGAEVRSITYDFIKDAFWTGNWSKDFYLINRQGNVLDTIPYNYHNQPSISGLAMEDTNSGGPYFWFFANKTQQPNFLGNLDQKGRFTGLGKDLTNNFAAGINNPKARGLNTYQKGNKKFLAGVIEGNPSKVFIYHLNSMLASNDASIVRVVSPSSACQLNSNENLTLEIANTGSDTITGIPFVVKLTNPSYYLYQDTITDTIPPYSSIDHKTSKAFYMGAINTYSFNIYTEVANDNYKNNDTLKEDIVNLPPDSLPTTYFFDSTSTYSGWSVMDANNDGYTWHQVEDEGINGSEAYSYSWNPDGVTRANDWLFTPCIHLEGNKYHALKFSAKVGIQGYDEMIKVFLGQNPDTSSMDKLITDRGKINADSFVVATDSFKLAQDGIYYLGFKIYSDPDAYKFFLDNIVIDQSVSIPTVKSKDVNIYPNPVHDQVFIETPHQIDRIKLLNSRGQLLLENRPKSKNTRLNLNEYSNGLYFIVIEQANQQMIRKIIKQ